MQIGLVSSMKKTLKILAAAAASLCLAGAAGCASATSAFTVDSYWYIDNYKGIQPTSVLDDEENAGRTPETLLYELTFAKNDGNGVYRVEYDTESENFAEGDDAHYFKTTFYAAHFDWSTQTAEKYRLTAQDVEKLSDADRARMDGTSEVVYVLETEMKVSGRYVFGAQAEATAENSVEFSDYMNTTTCFRSVNFTLEPVYSRQEAHSTSPAFMSPADKDSMCVQTEYSYETFYNYDCTEATYTYTENGGSESDSRTVGELNKTPNAMFDNNTLYTAIRGMSLSDGFSATLSLFTPANFGIFNVSVAGNAGGELDPEEDADIISALTSAYGMPEAEENDDEENGEAEEEHSRIFYNSVAITAASELHGTTQTAWFAAVEDESNNTYRATMLRLYVPLSFGLGAMEYRLAEVESVLGQKA